MKTISKARSRRRHIISFSIFVFCTALAVFLFLQLQRQEKSDEQPLVLRRGLEFNETFWSKLYKPTRKDPVKKAPPKGQPARVNGKIGLESPIDLKNWKMTVAVTSKEDKDTVLLTLTMDDIKKLPRTEIVNQFKCIEGWSEVMSFAGVKFSDFLKAYQLGMRDGIPGEYSIHNSNLYSHVGLETPDGEYYVSVDMRSMLAEETLLAYEINGEPLSNDHGAPLRLVIPNKYGVKSLKRIGTLRFANHRLPDYWGEDGYDWYLGL